MDHFVSNVTDYFANISKKHEAVTDNPPIRIYVQKIENRTAFKIKAGYYVEFSIPKMMKLLGSTKIRYKW